MKFKVRSKRIVTVLAANLALFFVGIILSNIIDISAVNLKDECHDAQTKVELGEAKEFSYNLDDDNVIGGICIKSGVNMFDDSHSGILGNGIFEDGCYTISGIGTKSVDVKKNFDTPQCQDLSHIEIYKGLISPIDTPIPTPEIPATGPINPTPIPTIEPTPEPTVELTPIPTAEPTPQETPEPTIEPTAIPTSEPTVEPNAEPTSTPVPTDIPENTLQPTNNPENTPVPTNTNTPSNNNPTSTPAPTGQVLGWTPFAETGGFENTLIAAGGVIIAFGLYGFITQTHKSKKKKK